MEIQVSNGRYCIQRNSENKYSARYHGANTGLDNITDAGKTVIRNVAKGAVKVVNGQNTTVTTGHRW